VEQICGIAGIREGEENVPAAHTLSFKSFTSASSSRIRFLSSESAPVPAPPAASFAVLAPLDELTELAAHVTPRELPQLRHATGATTSASSVKMIVVVMSDMPPPRLGDRQNGLGDRARR
jgi:hypothetical protein